MNQQHTSSEHSVSLVITFAATLFTSASLMFVLQPMFGKLLLPLLGGSPAVWNTCMVFYQTILFLGYLYAHFLSTRLNAHRQILIHTAVILLSIIFLPLALPENISPPTTSDPSLWLFWTLLLAIGLPFFIVSTTAPLLQKWFSNIGHHTSHDPYYLYAASNSGSLLALLSYPFLIEPNIGLNSQQQFWSIAYLLLLVLIAACAIIFWRSKQLPQKQPPEQLLQEPSGWSKLHWLVLAFVPSSLLLGLTNFISTDIAAVPLLWIIPLTLYLLSFILVFSKWAARIHRIMLIVQPVVLLPFLAYSFVDPASLPFWADLILHLSAFFLAVMVCHGELAKSRPPTAYLTKYYLIMSFAGMLGGLFNTFVAPFIFNAVYEYPIMIIAALLLRPMPFNKTSVNFNKLLLETAWPVLLLLTGLIFYFSVDKIQPYIYSISGLLILLAGLTYNFRHNPVSLALQAGVIILFALSLRHLLSHTLYQERTFFGVSSVREETLINEQQQPENYHSLFHGTTEHGAQRLPTVLLQRTPLTYYSRPGPMGQLFKAYDDVDTQWQIGIIGLGAGALACYSKAQQSWTFYEIDPGVVAIAKNKRFFSYLSLCNDSAVMRIGDARLSLQKDPGHKYDLLVVDAFSSDSVPAHLLTQQAMRLYFSRLKADGLLAFHITNRHLTLKKVLADHAERLKLSGLIQEFKPLKPLPLVVATDWVILSRHAQALEPLRASRLGNWQKLPLMFDFKPWTDDFTNIIAILK